MIAGHYTDVGVCSVNVHRQINRKHLDIRGCWGSEPGHFLRALTMLERYASRVPWRDVGGPTYSLTALNEALADAEAMRITKAIVDPWSRPRVRGRLVRGSGVAKHRIADQGTAD